MKRCLVEDVAFVFVVLYLQFVVLSKGSILVVKAMRLSSTKNVTAEYCRTAVDRGSTVFLYRLHTLLAANMTILMEDFFDIRQHTMIHYDVNGMLGSFSVPADSSRRNRNSINSRKNVLYLCKHYEPKDVTLLVSASSSVPASLLSTSLSSSTFLSLPPSWQSSATRFSPSTDTAWSRNWLGCMISTRQ